MVRGALCFCAAAFLCDSACSFGIAPAAAKVVSIKSRSCRTGRTVISTVLCGKKKRALEVDEDGIVQQSKAELKKLDELAAQLLNLCTTNARDTAAIQAQARELGSKAVKPAQSAELSKDWRLVYVSSGDVLGALGSGLHKLPLTRMEDQFVSFAGSRGLGREITTTEVLRVIGPFPNVKNVLSGTYKSMGISELLINYTSMIDGTGKEITSGNAAMDGNVSMEVVFVGSDVMVTAPRDASGARQVMVYQREEDLEGALKRLRVT